MSAPADTPAPSTPQGVAPKVAPTPRKRRISRQAKHQALTGWTQLTPGGSGPASAISILMALIAGVLAIIYALAQRKTNN